MIGRICFQSIAFEKTSEGYLTKGNLTIRGIAKEVSIPFSFDGTVFKGDLKVSRYDFEVGKDTGIFLIKEEIEISIVFVLE